MWINRLIYNALIIIITIIAAFFVGWYVLGFIDEKTKSIKNKYIIKIIYIISRIIMSIFAIYLVKISKMYMR